MTEAAKRWLRERARFKGIFEDQTNEKGKKEPGKFGKAVPASSFASYGRCREYVNAVLESGFDGEQTWLLEEELAKYMGLKHSVAASSGQAALTLALKLAAEKLYGSSTGVITPDGIGSGGCLQGRKVFCSDLAECSMVNPIVLEGGEPVFIDCGSDNCTMDPEVLAAAFEKHPDVKVVVVSEPYGFPGDVPGIRKACSEHDALMVECVSDSFGAQYWVGGGGPDEASDAGSASDGAGPHGVWAKAGTLGDYCVLDFGRGKIIGPKGGALVVRDYYESEKARYWAGNAGAAAPWNQHEELGYSCLIGELDAAVIRGQMKHIDEIIEGRKRIYDRYYEKLDGPMAGIIYAGEQTKPNYGSTVMTVESSIQFNEVRNDRKYAYTVDHGTAAPMEIYDVLQAFGADCAPVYKPMSMQPVYKNYEHFTPDGAWRMYESFSSDVRVLRWDNAKDFYENGIVLPGGRMSGEEQDKVIGLICACYNKEDLDRLMWV